MVPESLQMIPIGDQAILESVFHGEILPEDGMVEGIVE